MDDLRTPSPIMTSTPVDPEPLEDDVFEASPVPQEVLDSNPSEAQSRSVSPEVSEMSSPTAPSAHRRLGYNGELDTQGARWIPPELRPYPPVGWRGTNPSPPMAIIRPLAIRLPPARAIMHPFGPVAPSRFLRPPTSPSAPVLVAQRPQSPRTPPSGFYEVWIDQEEIMPEDMAIAQPLPPIPSGFSISPTVPFEEGLNELSNPNPTFRLVAYREPLRDFSNYDIDEHPRVQIIAVPTSPPPETSPTVTTVTALSRSPAPSMVSTVSYVDVDGEATDEVLALIDAEIQRARDDYNANMARINQAAAAQQESPESPSPENRGTNEDHVVSNCFVCSHPVPYDNETQPDDSALQFGLELDHHQVDEHESHPAEPNQDQMAPTSMAGPTVAPDDNYNQRRQDFAESDDESLKDYNSEEDDNFSADEDLPEGEDRKRMNAYLFSFTNQLVPNFPQPRVRRLTENYSGASVSPMELPITPEFQPLTPDFRPLIPPVITGTYAVGHFVNGQFVETRRTPMSPPANSQFRYIVGREMDIITVPSGTPIGAVLDAIRVLEVSTSTADTPTSNSRQG